MKVVWSFLITAAVLFFCIESSVAQDPTYRGVSACQPCHSGVFPIGNQFTPWQGTAHATAYDSVSAFAQNTARCLECHTTGWDTLAVNQGADEFVTITPPYSGSNNVTIADQTGFNARKNVQCESCHGPASLHAANFTAVDPPMDPRQAGTCGECHQGEHTPYLEDWSESAHSTSDTNPVPSLQSRFRTTDCSGCHTYQGFIQFVGTTPEDSVNIIPEGIDAPGDAAIPLVCAACHDPHDAKHPGQLRLPAGDLCAKCHNPENAVVGEEPHHSTAPMFEGTGAAEIAGYTYDRQSVHQILPALANDKCVVCHVHMTEFDDNGTPADPSDDILANTGHSFEPRLEACAQSGCHVGGLVQTAIGPFDHRGRQTFTQGLLDSLGSILAEIETNGISAADSGDYEIGLFNYQFVTNERSRGVHNPDYAETVLENTIAFLDTAIVTSVALPDPDAGLPQRFELHQNYPNPFNPSTTIRFDVAQRAHVKLMVYNSLGQEIETLVDQQLAASSYTVNFNAAGLSSGIYYYRIISDNFVTTKKMLLLK
jgi:predicted CXXCH cytochrome family protein